MLCSSLVGVGPPPAGEAGGYPHCCAYLNPLNCMLTSAKMLVVLKQVSKPSLDQQCKLNSRYISKSGISCAYEMVCLGEGE